MEAVKAVLGRIWSVWKRIGHGITRVLNTILLVLAYILAIGPTAIALRITGADPLDKAWKPDDDRSSFWNGREGVPDDPELYTRQF